MTVVCDGRVPLSASARVSGSSAAILGNSTSPSRSREYSGSIGSDLEQQVGWLRPRPRGRRATGSSYCSSGNALPSPPSSRRTSCRAGSLARAAGSAPRYSSVRSPSGRRQSGETISPAPRDSRGLGRFAIRSPVSARFGRSPAGEGGDSPPLGGVRRRASLAAGWRGGVLVSSNPASVFASRSRAAAPDLGDRQRTSSRSPAAGDASRARPSAANMCIARDRSRASSEDRQLAPRRRSGLPPAARVRAVSRLLALLGRPAGRNRQVLRVASRSCRTSATYPSSSTATIATAHGCSMISRSVSPQRSTVRPSSDPSYTRRTESGSRLMRAPPPRARPLRPPSPRDPRRRRARPACGSRTRRGRGSRSGARAR